MIFTTQVTLDSIGDFDPIALPAWAWGVRRIRLFEANGANEYYLASRAAPAASEKSLHTMGQVHEFAERIYYPSEVLAFGATLSGTATFTIEMEI